VLGSGYEEFAGGVQVVGGPSGVQHSRTEDEVYVFAEILSESCDNRIYQVPF